VSTRIGNQSVHGKTLKNSVAQKAKPVSTNFGTHGSQFVNE